MDTNHNWDRNLVNDSLGRGTILTQVNKATYRAYIVCVTCSRRILGSA
jgi:hypothetical protein